MDGGSLDDSWSPWSQGRTGFQPDGDFSFGREWGRLFDIHPHDVFLVIFSYGFEL